MQAGSFKLYIATQNGNFFFDPEEIVRLEAKSNYTNFHFRSRRPILSAKVLKEYEKQLEPFGFIRTHRSHLVNKKHVVSTDGATNLILQDLSKLEVSRRMRKSVMNALRG